MESYKPIKITNLADSRIYFLRDIRYQTDLMIISSHREDQMSMISVRIYASYKMILFAQCSNIAYFE